MVNPDTITDSSFQSFLPVWEECISGFINGNPSIWKNHNSQSDSATFFGAFGGNEKGWTEISARLDWASSKFKESGAKVRVEYISIIVNEDFAYTVSIERGEERFGNMEKAAPRALRSTQIFRKENGEWKLLHRHADPLFEKKVTDTNPQK
ncbi:MAG TPA: nuclear transport factor 2 family protein [Mucilaginibacter sp.]|jgi:ketosteroid isomerase-like protein